MRFSCIVQLIILLFTILTSCSSGVNTNTQKRENDLEKNGYKGKVKEITHCFSNNEVIFRYNKSGFETETIVYTDKVLRNHFIYKYNEHGGLITERIKDKDRLYEIIYENDRFQNPIKKIEKTIEVYNPEECYEIGEKLLNTYENTYSKAGKLIRILTKDSNGQPIHYDEYYENGITSKTADLDEYGKPFWIHDMEYEGNKFIKSSILIKRYNDTDIHITTIRNSNGTEIEYNEFYDFPIYHKYDTNGLHIQKRTLKKSESSKVNRKNGNENLIEEVTEYEYDHQGNLIKETCTSYNKGNRKIINKTVIINSYKYDSKGNMIYAYRDGEEETFKFTYYE